VSPNARGRAREKNRQQLRQLRRELETRRNKQVVLVIVAMLVIIGGFVGLSLVMRKDVPKPLGSGCSAPPKVPNDKRTGTLPDKAVAAGRTFVATVATNCGVITMELDGTRAPQTVASFLGLAKSGYWADSPCHRLTTTGIFVLQCGDPTGTGNGNPGYGFGVENAPADQTYAPGTLAMARTPDPKSNGGQFFVVYKKTVIPDTTGYSIFGKVTSGMDIVDKIAAAGVKQSAAGQDTAPMQPVSILTVNVAEKKVGQ
jgi:peptidyl-prolyl cis-trans isomerase B (cyclophilin B)